mgnify:CR=1 FL=1
MLIILHLITLSSVPTINVNGIPSIPQLNPLINALFLNGVITLTKNNTRIASNAMVSSLFDGISTHRTIYP